MRRADETIFRRVNHGDMSRQSSRRTSRRAVLGALATASTTAVAGCGYRPGRGDVVWRRPREGAAAHFVDDIVVELKHGETRSVPDRLLSVPHSTLVERDPVDGEAYGEVGLSGPSDFTMDVTGGLVLVLDDRGQDPDPEPGTYSLPDVASLTEAGFVREWTFEAEVRNAAVDSDRAYVLSESDTLVGSSIGAPDPFLTRSVTPSGDEEAVTALAANERGCVVAFAGVDGRLSLQGYSPEGDARFVLAETPPEWSADDWPPRWPIHLELVDDVLVFGGPDVVLFDAASGDFLEWVDAPPGRSTISRDESTAYVASGSELYAYDVDERTMRWTHEIDASVNGYAPVVAVMGDAVVFQVGATAVVLGRERGGVQREYEFENRTVIGGTDEILTLVGEDNLFGQVR